MSSRAKKPIQFPDGTPSVRELLEAGWVCAGGNTLDAKLATRGQEQPRMPLHPSAPHEAWQTPIRMGQLTAIRGHERTGIEGDGEARWHLSISHRFRLPTWEEIRAVRDALLPADVVLCIPHPPRAWWLSLHPNCLHLWEINDPDLERMWQHEGEQAKRMGYGTPTPATSR